MQLESIKIKNFRTITDDEVFHIGSGLTLVGPNSSGKTNILKAIELFFTGPDNKHGYSFERDIPNKSRGSQTSLVATFIADQNSDSDIISAYANLNQLLENPKTLDNRVVVYLLFSKSGQPIYRLFSGDKQKDDKKDEITSIQTDIISLILGRFSCHYVPSSKSINSLYCDLLLPNIRRSIAGVLSDKTEEIKAELKKISLAIDKQFSTVGMGHIKSHLRIPDSSIEKLLGSFEYHISDPETTEIDRKGMGVQASAIFASLLWITSEEKKENKSTVWLIEEPESYLHPELAHVCNKMLKNLQEQASLVITTHSLSFVPQDPRRVSGTSSEDGYTKIIKFDSYIKATDSIRKSLGVKLSDFYNLGSLNVFVEGKSDRELFKWVLEKIQIQASGKHAWENTRAAEFLDFGGVKQLEGFMKASYEYIRKERPTVTILDGDSAGDSVRNALQGYFGNKEIPFNANEHFILLPRGFSIEGLFPHQWIKDIQKEHPKWFKSFAQDLNGELMPFEMKDEATKEQLREHLKKRATDDANLEWAASFGKVFEAIDFALEDQKEKIK